MRLVNSRNRRKQANNKRIMVEQAGPRWGECGAFLSNNLKTGACYRLVADGWSRATGQYFANAALSGTAAFTRVDVRIDADWNGLSPAGSNSLGYSSVGATNWSAQWNGDVIPAYSQTYTFSLTSSGGARLYIRPAGSTTYTTLVNDWTVQTAPRTPAPTPWLPGRNTTW